MADYIILAEMSLSVNISWTTEMQYFFIALWRNSLRKKAIKSYVSYIILRSGKNYFWSMELHLQIQYHGGSSWLSIMGTV